MKNFLVKANYSWISLYGILNLIFCFAGEETLAQETVSNRILSNSVDRISQRQEQASKNKKPKFPNRGIPTGRRRGGTSRSGCSELDSPLTAIVPGKEIRQTAESSYVSSPKEATQTKFSKSESFLARTLEEYPTFWIYIPENNLQRQGEFVLQDEQDREIYRAFFDLPHESGFLNLKLPPQPQNSLQIGLKYHWYAKIFCEDRQDREKYIFVDAWIERVTPTPELARKLNTQNPNRYQIFAEGNLWHDAIDTLAANRQTSPQNYDNWNHLLDTLGLSDLINSSFPNTKANFPAAQTNSKDRDGFPVPE